MKIIFPINGDRERERLKGRERERERSREREREREREGDHVTLIIYDHSAFLYIQFTFGHIALVM